MRKKKEGLGQLASRCDKDGYAVLKAMKYSTARAWWWWRWWWWLLSWCGCIWSEVRVSALPVFWASYGRLVRQGQGKARQRCDVRHGMVRRGKARQAFRPENKMHARQGGYACLPRMLGCRCRVVVERCGGYWCRVW